jgi:hypothetical protein
MVEYIRHVQQETERKVACIFTDIIKHQSFSEQVVGISNSEFAFIT